jgi:hypothetical protein
MESKPIAKREAYSRITVTLPTFIVIIVQQVVKRANEKSPGESLSSILERFLLHTFTAEEYTKAGEEWPEFKRAAEAWIRWEAQERERGNRPDAPCEPLTP